MVTLRRKRAATHDGGALTMEDRINIGQLQQLKQKFEVRVLAGAERDAASF